MDRVELWEFGTDALYKEIVVIEGGKAIVPENVIAMLLSKVGYKKVKTFNYE